MAFVSRSERNIIISTRDKDIPGPGQYLRIPMMNMNMNMTSQLKAPFNSSFIKDKHIKEPSPGPGSYNILMQPSKSTIDLSKAINTNTNAYTNGNANTNSNVSSTIDHNSMSQILVKNNNERLGFLTKVGRFQEQDSIKKASLPNLNILLKANDKGGHEDIDMNAIKDKDKDSNKKECKAMTYRQGNMGTVSIPGSIKRVVSIPSKDMRGYVVEKNGDALMILDTILNDDDRLNDTDNGNNKKKSSIGPGSYDISPKWKSNAINWNKTSNNNEDVIKKKTKNALDSYINEFKRQGEFIPHVPNLNPNANVNVNLDYINEDKKLIYNHFRLRKKVNLNPLLSTTKDKTRKMSYLTKTENLGPGPGYYTSDKLFNLFHTDGSYSNKYGSYASRFPYDTNANTTKSIKTNEAGPGSYFRTKTRLDKEEEEKKYYKGLQYKTLYKANEALIEKNRKLINCSNSFAGPGSYDLQQEFIKESLSNKELLKSGPERFIPEFKKEKRPGPGEYLDLNVLSKRVNMERERERISITRGNNTNTAKSKENSNGRSIIQRSMSPPVGLYNTEVYGTIQYQNELKINRPQANIAPFLNTSNRFDLFSKSVSPIGPGAYMKNIEKSNLLKENKNACFNSKEKRFKVDVRMGNGSGKVGPQDYDTTANLNWNKRSYNVLFFKPK